MYTQTLYELSQEAERLLQLSRLERAGQATDQIV